MIRHYIPLLLATLLLAGCPLTGDRETAATDYVKSLAGLLDTEPRFSGITTVVPLPRSRERRLDLPELEMGLVDFLSLYGCELQVVVGERTSVLGRVAHPGTRMEYHLRFISAAQECLPKIDSESRAESIREALETKRDSIPEALWNGVWGSSEMEAFFSRSGGTLPPQLDSAVVPEAQGHLESIRRLIEGLEPGMVPAGLDRLNTVYEHWQSRPLAGQFLRSAEALRSRLDDATALIRHQLGREGGCAAAEGDYQRFFKIQYLGAMEPRLRLVRNEGRQLFSHLYQLVHAPGATVPDAMTPFIQRNLQSGPGSVWHALDASIRDHMAAWNQLLAQCRPR